MRNIDDKQFEELLGKAFKNQYENEINNGPSEKDLNAMYPFTEKQLDKAKKLSRKHKKERTLWVKSLGKAAVILLCVTLGSGAIAMTNPAIRGNVSEVVGGWIDQYLSVDFTEASGDEVVDITKANITYIPEGFTLEQNNSDKENVSLMYSNDNNEFIIIDIINSKDIKLMTENETHRLTNYKINGYEGYISYSDEMKQGSVYFGSSNFTVAVSAMTEKEDLIKIAKSIDFKG